MRFCELSWDYHKNKEYFNDRGRRFWYTTVMLQLIINDLVWSVASNQGVFSRQYVN